MRAAGVVRYERVTGRGGRGACRFLLYAAAQFFVLTMTAMALYPGGNAQDPAQRGYSFFENFFSDLGQTSVRYSAARPANTVSMVLFVIALVTVGVAVVVAAWPIGVAVSAPRGRLGALVIGLAGSLAGAGFIGVAANPWNLRLGVHIIAVKVAFFGLLVLMVAVAVQAARNRWPRWFVALGWVYALALAAYFADLLWGPGISTSQGALVQSVSQKAIVYLSIACLSAIAWGVIRYAGVSASAARGTPAGAAPDSATVSASESVSLSEPDR